ncbi:MAG: glycosyltransferase [Patescibacteria group bacterium]
MKKRNKTNFKLSIVAPVYNETENIASFYSRLKKSVKKYKHEIIFIDDGSSDGSVGKLEQISKKDKQTKVLIFSRNFGHQIAITAGIDNSSGDATVIIDSDLQDPPELIPSLVSKWLGGYEVVYAVRRARKDSWFKKITASIFYKILVSITEIKIPANTGDFRLIDKKVASELSKMPEKSRFIRGLVPWIGFSQTSVFFNRDKRHHGKTKYSFGKMLKLSLHAITSFSNFSLKLISYAGFILFIVGFLGGIGVIIFRSVMAGNLYLILLLISVIALTSGLILIALGILGEYVGRIYTETQNRPLYIIKDKINFR